MKLNKIEKLKIDLKPFDFYEKIEGLDPEKLTEADRFYLKNFGIYNTKLRPDKFMLRIRIPAGRISLDKLERIVNYAKEKNAKIILTSRAQIELHNLAFKDALNLHKKLENIGVTTFATLTDNFRNIVTDPLDGIGEENIFEVYPLILKMQNIFLKNPEFLGMIPRKFNTAISANKKNISPFFANDCYFALAKKDGIYGFNLYLGGKNLDVAKDADIFVEKEKVIDIFKAVIYAYKKYGLRENRTKARLYHLIEKIGIDGFKDMIKEFYKKDFEKKGELVFGKFKKNRDFFKLKDEKFAYRFKTNFGEIDVDEFEKIINLSKENGYEVRLGVDQNIYIIGLENENIPLNGLSQNQNLIACAGSRYCIFSLFDTKDEAKKLILDDINKYNIKIGYSGCLKGCARHILADIGFVGIRTNLFGEVERGVRLYLGGLFTAGVSPARLIYWAVPLRKLNDILKVIIEEFKNSGYKDFEEFSKNVLNGYSTEFLAFWFLYKMKNRTDIFLNEKEENFIKKFNINNLYESIKELEQAVLGK